MNIEFLESEDFHFQFNKSGKTPLARLLGLSGMLKQWNQQRLEKAANASDNNTAVDISIQQIDVLKELISSEVTKLKLKNSEVVADQLLFLIIGSIKLHTESRSDKPWELVNQSVKSFLNPKRTLPSPLLILLFSTLVVVFGMSTNLMKAHKKEAAYGVLSSYTAPVSEPTLSEASKATLSNLQVLYNRMRIGDCQIPQAAMVGEEEKDAFIEFVNNGTVDLKHTDRLISILGHVNCLYTYKLIPMYTLQPQAE